MSALPLEVNKDGTASIRSLAGTFFLLGGCMKPLTGHQIRQLWLKFFNAKGHQTIPGASLIPYNDPTLLWINSGVAAIKRYFDGSEIPTQKRLTNVQKSIRTNDIENVGYTARHHTFFEMLGNFSIGDYFRKEAIEWAFEILTSSEYFALDVQRLYATYNPSDVLSKQYWEACGLPADHLIPLEGNYWQIGEGPCGPNTEVFFDRGEKYDSQKQGIELLKQDISNDRYIEIWGIVFSQYNAVDGQRRDQYKELPSKNIDTGAGLERLACIMQETPTNFETDLFYPVIQATEKLASISYKDSEYRPYRVIADHIRTLTFALTDGALFSNEGRGYVLRRILRRALRYGKKIGIHDPFLFTLVPTVANMMGDFYPELKQQQTRVAKIIQAEELKFIHTLSTGEQLLKKHMDEGTITSEQAFKLYDTYGFPIELTIEMASEKGMVVDRKGFDKLMDDQRERARQARVSVSSMQKQSADLLAFKTPSSFVYDGQPIQGKVIGLFIDGVSVNTLDEEGYVVFDQTNFYAESGGQIADQGSWENSQTRLEVLDVQKAPNKQPMHFVKVSYGKVSIGDMMTGTIQPRKRQSIMKNHSALHLLQYALRSVLGTHVSQRGSYAGEDYARFDFTHNGKITYEDIQTIESLVNEEIASSYSLQVEILPIEEARKTGAIAPFDETYGEFVRVVTLGPHSKEFCAGTHVENTQDIGIFAIVSEESIAAGTRRITIKTSTAAYHVLKQREKMLYQVQETLQAKSPVEIRDRLQVLVHEKENLKQQTERLLDIVASQEAQFALHHKNINEGRSWIIRTFKKTNKEMLTRIADRLKSEVDALILVGEDEGVYPLLVVFNTKTLPSPFLAGSFIKSLTAILGGSGGGRPEQAFGAVKTIEHFEETVIQLRKTLHS